MNPNESHSASPMFLFGELWRQRSLIWQMVQREVVGRYKGSVIGLGWSFFNPVLMLAVYTFVFSVVFKARWGISNDESRIDFALLVFVGLIVHTFLSEVLNRASDIILNNSNYVKKVVFPIEVLPVVATGSALFHALVSFVVLLIALLVVNGGLHWTIVYAPLILIPIILVTVGVSWILASFGTFLRDIGQTVGIVTTIMLFLAPIFYPMKAIPEKYHIFILLNPLTFVIEELREVIIFGNQPNFMGLGIYWLVCICIFFIGFAWFQKTRRAFADVL